MGTCTHTWHRDVNTVTKETHDLTNILSRDLTDREMDGRVVVE